MLNIEKTISNFVEQQFPFFLQEEGPMFIEFVKQYYVWMETENAIYHSRNLPEYTDIDSTTDAFLIYFKEKYLKDIQFNTATSLRRMTKHSLDLYRSKGTPRAIDLLFKVVFDTPAEVYLPGNDILKLSSGNFYEQIYLEVIPSPSNIIYVGKEIIGLQSGATAFIEKLTRKKIKGTYVEVFTVSALRGHFITGEFIKTVNQSSIVNNPKIIGSLTNVDILSASYNFAVGDIVNIESGKGIGAKGRVTAVSEVTGEVDFKLVDGGFGYSTDSEVQISEKIFRIANVVTNTAISNTYFSDYDIVSANQYGIDLYNISGTSGTSLSNFIGSHFYNYYSNGAVRGEFVLQDFNSGTSNTNGQAYVTLLNGNVDCRSSQTNSYYNIGNTISANLAPLGIVNFSSSANVLGTTANLILDYANSLNFSVGEYVYQIDNNNIQTANANIIVSSYVGVTGTLTLNNFNGVFDLSKNLYSSNTSINAVITGLTLDVGINNIQSYACTISSVTTTASVANISISNTVSLFPFMNVSGNTIPSDTYISFITVGNPNNTITLSNAPLLSNSAVDVTFKSQGSQFYSNADSQVFVKKYEGNVYTTGILTHESVGALANFVIANTLGNPETLEINTDYLYPKLPIYLSASDYAFQNTVINVNSHISDALNYTEKTIGTILNITGINNGEGYDVPPVIKINNHYISEYDVRDVYLSISNSSALFFTGEIVNQPNTGAKGIVKEGNSSILSLRLINFENVFSNNCPNTTIVGSGSGTTAQVSVVEVNHQSQPMGKNAVVTANVVSQNGSVASISVIDSGYGFLHREQGTFTSEDGTRVGTLQMLLGNRTEQLERDKGREGHSLGYYRSQDGFLSNDKKIYDAYYYQDYSYEVRSSVTLDKYEAMLKQLLHVAGTKYFANTITSSAIPVSTTISLNFDKYNFTVDTNTVTSDTTQYTSDTTYVEGYTG